MSSEHQRELEIFTEAVQRPAPERDAFLDAACAGHPDLRQRVAALLASHASMGGFLEDPPEGTPTRPGIGEGPGDRIDRYKLLQQIGEGGCGVVFMAEQEEPVRRRVALKILKPGMDTRSVIARFEAERQALAMMDHPNIAKVLDAGATASGRPYFVMELIRGLKITDFCDQHRLTTTERLELFIDVCHALQHAHQKGIIHRDLKPSNILVTEGVSGTAVPMVIDFGIAKAIHPLQLTAKTHFTAFELFLGTPAYMSPEQAALTSVDVDTRSDIYSLGVLLYELLTGSPPFDTRYLLEAGLDEIRRTIREREPLRPSTRLVALPSSDLTTVAQRRRSEAPRLVRSMRGDLDWIVMKALEKDRTRRYATANGLALDVRRFLANETIAARPPGRFYRFSKTVRRNPLLAACVAALAVLLVAGLITMSTLLAREQKARLAADAAVEQARADQARSEAESAKSRQITRFLEDMLAGVGPSVAQGRDTRLLEDILQRTAVRVGTELSGQPTVEAALRGLMGRILVELGKYEEAEAMHRAALALLRTHGGDSSLEYAATLQDLGNALWKQRQLAEADTAFTEALRQRRLHLGDDDPEVATTLVSLGSVRRREGRLTEAEGLIRAALAIREKRFGAQSLEVADALRNLAIVLGDLGRFAEAETTARTTLAVRRERLGPDHPLVAASLADLAWVIGFTGRTAEAEAIEVEALSLQRRLLGDQHPEVVRSMASLGGRLRERGNLAESQALLAAAASVQRQLLGEDHPDVLATLHSLGQTLERDQRPAEAEKAYREAFERWRRLGPQHPRLAVEAEALTRVLFAQRRYVPAAEVLDSLFSTNGAAAPEASAQLLTYQAEAHARLGRWDAAAQAARRVVEVQPDEHYGYHRLGPLLVITGAFEAHRTLCREILARFGETTDPFIAERMAKGCLLRPLEGFDLGPVERLATRATAAAAEPQAQAYFEAGKALCDYRLGRWEAAIHRVRGVSETAPLARAHACAVAAMAHWRLAQELPARTMLAKGESLAPDAATMMVRENGSLGEEWVAWLMARLALEEAAALMRTPPPTRAP